MTAVCGRDGQWTPNPGGVTCSPRPTLTLTQTSTQVPTQTLTWTSIGLPSSPQSPTTIFQYGPHNLTVRVQWGYPQNDGGAPVDNYTVTLVGPGTVHLSTTISVQPVATFTLAYNEEYTVSIAATNCVGTGGTVSLNISEGTYQSPGVCIQPVHTLAQLNFFMTSLHVCNREVFPYFRELGYILGRHSNTYLSHEVTLSELFRCTLVRKASERLFLRLITLK